MVGKSKPANPEQKARMAQIRTLGCVACVLMGRPNSPGTVHHLVEGTRLGHSATIACCRWHHFGEPWPGYQVTQMTALIGPSLAHGSKPFRAQFGDDATLLKVQDFMLSEFDSDPWLEFEMPARVVSAIFEYWTELRSANEQQWQASTAISD